MIKSILSIKSLLKNPKRKHFKTFEKKKKELSSKTLDEDLIQLEIIFSVYDSTRRLNKTEKIGIFFNKKI